MGVKWIIADIDGCITPEESVPWDLELFWKLARISREASEGRGRVAPLTLCTGRPQPYVEVLAKLLDIRAPIICENGAVLYTMHDNRSRYGPGVTNEKTTGLRAVRAFLETDILPNCPDAVYQFGKEAHMSVFSQKPELFDEIAPRIIEFVERRGGPDLDIVPSHYYLNISMRGVDKGRALRAVCSELRVDKAQVAGIGDTEGDLPLRDAVRFFACPSNAKPAVKEAADYVSPFPTIEGVLDILNLPEFARD
jgi:HAD superfamily hydrolase (TIGR01484 family)